MILFNGEPVTLAEAVKWRDPSWSWATSDGDTRVAYQTLDGRVTLAALIRHIEEVAPGALTDEVTVSFATIKWTRPATSEELADRQRAREASDARRAGWEARAMRGFIDRYGPDTSVWPIRPVVGGDGVVHDEGRDRD